MKFLSLQSLRGIFALVIFFHHFSYKGDGVMFAAGGDMGVAFFFILSGFVLSQGYFNREIKEANTVKFVVKRLSKIYPLHILCLIGSILLKASINLQDLSNVFLLQSWIPLKQWYFSGNSVGWCLSDFLFFYGLFPFICKFYKSRRSAFLKLYTAILTIYIILVIPSIPSQFQEGIIYISPLTRLFDFIFGIILWKFSKSLKFRVLRSNLHMGLFDVIISIVVTTIIWYEFPTPYNLSILWWPSLALVILYSVSTSNKLITLPPLAKFGDVSFSFYLIHVLNIKYLDIIFRKLNVFMTPSVRLISILSLTVIFSFLLHRYFVIPVEKIIRNKLLTYQ